VRLELETREGEHRGHLGRRRHRLDAQLVAAAALEVQLDKRLGEPLAAQRQPLGQARKQPVEQEQERLERDHRVLESDPLAQPLAHRVGDELVHRLAAGEAVQGEPRRAEAQPHLEARQPCQLATACHPQRASAEHDVDRRLQQLERQRRDERAFFPRCHDDDVRGAAGGDTGDVGTGGDADANVEADAAARAQQPVGDRLLAAEAWQQAVDVEQHLTGSVTVDARRKCAGDVGERAVRRIARLARHRAHVEAGARPRACAAVMPHRAPSSAACADTAISSSRGDGPATIASGASASSGRLRRSAWSGKSGTSRQATRTAHPRRRSRPGSSRTRPCRRRRARGAAAPRSLRASAGCRPRRRPSAARRPSDTLTPA